MNSTSSPSPPPVRRDDRAARPTTAPVVAVRAVERGLLGLRVLFGLVFLANGLAKVAPGIWNTPFGFLLNDEAARQILASEVRRHPFEPYRALIEGAVLPNWNVVGPALAAFEIGVGVLLLAGLGARWAAVAGAAFALHLHFLTLFNGRWLFEYALLWVPLLVLATTLPAGPWTGIGWRRAAPATSDRAADAVTLAGEETEGRER